MLSRSERVYAWLLRLYPSSYLCDFGEEMRFVFAASLQDATGSQGEGLVAFWRRTLADLGKTALREQISANGELLMRSAKLLSPNIAVVVAVLLFVPLFTLNLFAVGNNPGFDHFFRDVFSLSAYSNNPLGSAIVHAAVLLLPLGAFIALRPIFITRQALPLNLLVGILLLVTFVVFVGAMGEEAYRCDVLQVPKCD
jgi:hypothetical protein